ncbi:MAG: YraN family protein, partial [Anaerolinea sp.]|nr:YraN family protein [Anaerolinea sp.]
MTASQRARVGQYGEDRARAYLADHGYSIVQMRWRPAPPLRGDIDIIARQDDTIVFVEVRTRRGRDDSIERAYGSLGARKRSQLVRLAYAYIAEHDLADAVWRIDGIAVAVD